MTERTYRNIPPHTDLVANEHEILAFWREESVFDRSVAATAGRPTWTTFEGPPTANGAPGTHHIEARTFKDILPRFKTMQGFHVERRAGWDCHGLPVELAVEKELGFSGKPDIESFGIALFNDKCRESVMRHVDQWQELTHRMGYWVDMDHPYKTMDRSYIESVWWSLKEIFNRGLLEEDYRVAPYCPRCGTTLSDHELAQGYEEDTDPSVYVRFPVSLDHFGGPVSLLVWTTTPWTLVANTAVAVNPELTYVVATNGAERVILADEAVGRLLGSEWSVQESMAGRELLGAAYTPPFDVAGLAAGPNVHRVLGASYVSAGAGTGIVHLAPAFGADDLTVARDHDLPIVNPIEANGKFKAEIRLVGGEYFKDADEILISEMQKRGSLFQRVDFVHQYPHCWRCHTHLIYYALPSWYIRTTKVRDRMLEENERTNWLPENVKHGRFGDWLKNNVDWALSRSRYWGTPLPIWRNEETGRVLVVGSMDELAILAGRDLSKVEPHRPYIDDVTFRVDGEPGEFRRVPDVIDAWYDSGAMPFAQWGYPHVAGSAERFSAAYPAQFVSEAIDQTRGWFYSLMAVGTLVFDRNSYENVVSLGHILAEDGRKMSKHLGNTILPVPLMDEFGADAVRWFMACSGSPWAARLVSNKTLDEVVRKLLRTYWSAASFQSLYGSNSTWRPLDAAVPVENRGDLDRWVVGESHRLVRDVTRALETFDTQGAGARIIEFLDLLSNWYIRRSRRRFWSGDAMALSSLHDVLRTVTLVMAPFVPFVTERVWADMFRTTTDPDVLSVHLAAWPEVNESWIDDDLDRRIGVARRLVELGRAARKNAGVKVRQPLRRALVSTNLISDLSEDLRAEVAAELNVLELSSFESAGEVVTYALRPNFRTLGKQFGSGTQEIASLIPTLDASEVVAQLSKRGWFEFSLGDEQIRLGPDDVVVSEEPVAGWAVLVDQGEMIALDLELDEEMKQSGLAREIVRAVQEARKVSGFEISDRILLRWSGDARVSEVFATHSALIADEILASAMRVDDTARGFSNPDLGLVFALERA